MTTSDSDRKVLHDHARGIFRTAVDAVDPETAVQRHVAVKGRRLKLGTEQLNLDDFERILLVGAGKATAPMARALEAILENRISAGAIVVKDGHGLKLKATRVFEAGHPVPDGRGVSGSEAVLDLVSDAGKRDLVLCAISGGGSALMVAPAPGLTLADKQDATRHLLACGATIHEINTIRKHLSRIKGGLLAKTASPATVASLVLSDVVGDDLDVIASGPTVPDRSTFAEAEAILRRYGIWQAVAPAVRERIKGGVSGEFPETPKPGDPAFARGVRLLVGTNLQALEAAALAAGRLGYRPLVLTSKLEGEAREVAKVYGAIAREVVATGKPLAKPACILSGGETTVTLRGDGRGGRCQEFALAAAIALAGTPGVVVLAGGTDGSDGPTDAAGAVADGETIIRSSAMGVDARDHLRRNDAYRFFEKLDGLLVTGPTRTNVMDVYMLLVGG